MLKSCYEMIILLLIDLFAIISSRSVHHGKSHRILSVVPFMGTIIVRTCDNKYTVFLFNTSIPFQFHASFECYTISTFQTLPSAACNASSMHHKSHRVTKFDRWINKNQIVNLCICIKIQGKLPQVETDKNLQQGCIRSRSSHPFPSTSSTATPSSPLRKESATPFPTRT